MKTNGNDQRKGKYYVGLDVGTESCGWAVTDFDYNILKFKGKHMWGARIFSEAATAEERRSARSSRRRLQRRKQRLELLKQLFNNEITKVDNAFFRRFHDSFLQLEDKRDTSCKYALFNDANYTDKEYLKQYPTIYHLRRTLTEQDNNIDDPRLLFLALHHILKHRGHFLYDTSESEDGKTFKESYHDLIAFLNDNGISFQPENSEQFLSVLQKGNMTITQKKKELKSAYGPIDKLDENEEIYADMNIILELLSGATVKLEKLFHDPNLKDADEKSISLASNFDDKYDSFYEILDDRFDLIIQAKELYDIAKLGTILGDATYLSEAKVKQYDINRKDLCILKKYVKKEYPDKYKLIFEEGMHKENFAAYTQYELKEYTKRVDQETFCKFLKKQIPNMQTSENEEEKEVFEKISNNTFYTRLKGVDNGLVPYQLNLKELKRILSVNSSKFPFLNEKDESGLTVIDKVISLFTFRIPYYVGPLNKKAKNQWIERTPEKIYPWNFNNVVNLEKSAQNFMSNLIGKCTYTGENVLPLNSLLYSEYMVLNEINKIKVNGQLIPVEDKQYIFEKLFVESSKPVTTKRIKDVLLAAGKIERDDNISGVDTKIKSNLKSYHDFKDILERTHDEKQVEEIIESIIVFGDDKKMLSKWLKDNTHDLTEDDFKKILRLKYSDWGRLSRVFLEAIYHEDENGEVISIIDMLRNTNQNLMELLSDKYQFNCKAKKHRDEKFGVSNSIKDRLDEMYISPKVRRSIMQTMRIMDEIVDIQKAAPDTVFIEMARGEKEKKTTTTRKEKLKELYINCKQQESELFKQLENETEQSLRRDKLYLYYTQFGKCMYSGEPIDLEDALRNNEMYDIDHIFPQSRIKDDSLDNRVLVKKKLNSTKTNTYPISEDIRNKMASTWFWLRSKDFISPKKYERLTRNYPLTEEELASFIARQLVETQQSTKALATILEETYHTKIVYSKAGNVSDFRRKFDIPKYRNINNLHHAKDAYLNIVVGNVYDKKFTQKFIQNIGYEAEHNTYSLNQVFAYETKGAWIPPQVDERKVFNKTREKEKLSGTIQTVYKYVFKNTPIVTFAPVQVKGKISELTILPKTTKTKGKLPIKQNLSIEKYGGYDSLFAAYYFVVEHIERKKIKRTIEPVYIYALKQYEHNSIEYCERVLNLNSPKIIAKKILINNIVEINGSHLLLKGRSVDRIIYQHNYQFALDDQSAQYLKEIEKALMKIDNNPKYDLENDNHISKEMNQALYKIFVDKLNQSVYKPIFSSMIDSLMKLQSNFLSSSLLDQITTLSEILKVFKCDRQTANLEKIDGPATCGIIRNSKNITDCDAVYLIHQSVTGLYETKVDLLEGMKK